MAEVSCELAVDAACRLGEGPAWFYDRLWWVDIYGKRVHAFDPSTNDHETIDFEEMVSVVVPRRNGGLAIMTEHGFALSDTRNGRPLRYINDPEAHLPENRFNDGKCDPQGRLWAGTMHRHGRQCEGSLYVFTADLSHDPRVVDVSCSNGLAWSSDGRTMYYVDTPTRRVDAFDFDPDTGAISDRRPIVQFPEGVGYPDGMTIDNDGKLWVAMWGGWGVLHCDPETGEIGDKISVPAAHTTSCAFGGPDMADLYITSARDGISDEQLAKQPHAGGVFRARPGATGKEAYPFAG